MKNPLCERLLFYPDCASSQQNPKQLSVTYITNVKKTCIKFPLMAANRYVPLALPRRWHSAPAGGETNTLYLRSWQGQIHLTPD